MHGAAKNQKSMHGVHIGNPEGLQSLLRELHERHGNNEDEAARALGITQSTFSRLLTGASNDTMAYTTYDSICSALGGEPQVLGRGRPPTPFAVGVEYLGPEERARLIERARRDGQDPQAVLDAEAEAKYDLLQRFLDAIVTDDEEWVWSHYEAWMDQELERLRPVAEPVLRELWEAPRTRRPIADFLDAVKRSWDELPSDSDRRCWLALCRAVEPLITAAPATWGVERSLEDLMKKAPELRAYLKAALKREELLLNPTRDLDRVRRGRPPMSYQQARESMAVEEAIFYDNHPSASPFDFHGWLYVRSAFLEAHPSATEHDWQAVEAEYEAYFRNPPPLRWKDWEVVRSAGLEEESTPRGYRDRRRPGSARPWVPDLPRLGPEAGDERDDG